MRLETRNRKQKSVGLTCCILLSFGRDGIRPGLSGVYIHRVDPEEANAALVNGIFVPADALSTAMLQDVLNLWPRLVVAVLILCGGLALFAHYIIECQSLTHFLERELKKYNRELNNLTSKTDDLQKIDVLHKRVSDLFTSMKRLERDNQKNKKRGDQLQKERDHARADLSKTTTLKEKLEKLCRELQRENNRLKVRHLEIGLVERRC